MEISYDKIEHLKKVVSSHRASLDFDKAFLMDKVESADFDFEKEIEQGVKVKKERKRKRDGT